MDISGDRIMNESVLQREFKGDTMGYVAAKNKQNEPPEPPDSGGGRPHKRPGVLLRLHQLMLQQLDILVERNATDRTEEIRRAIREYLEREKLWPPPKH
jgi:hypothetical protein